MRRGGKDVIFAANGEHVPAVYFFSPPSWTPDGNRIVFTALIGEARTRFRAEAKTMLGVIPAAGGRVVSLPGTLGASHPVVSPDGVHVAFSRTRVRERPNGQGGGEVTYSSTSIWLADLAGGRPDQLTPWRNGELRWPSSFSPDGTRLAFSAEVGGKLAAMSIALDGSAEALLAHNAYEPVYSPDGARFAFLRGPLRVEHRDGGRTAARMTDLYVASPASGAPQRLTATENAVELTPSWDPSGRRLAYSSLEPFRSDLAGLGIGGEVKEINADGTCPITVLSGRRSVQFGPAWQPGPGREAGPIVC